jgi:hypothetical protein
MPGCLFGYWVHLTGGTLRRAHLAEVYRQLKARPDSVDQAWLAAGLDLGIAKLLCRKTAGLRAWPNDRFIPDDPIDVVLDDPWGDLDMVDVLLDCEQELGIHVLRGSGGDFEHSTTMGDLVRELMKARGRVGNGAA